VDLDGLEEHIVNGEVIKGPISPEKLDKLSKNKPGQRLVNATKQANASFMYLLKLATYKPTEQVLSDDQFISQTGSTDCISMCKMMGSKSGHTFDDIRRFYTTLTNHPDLNESNIQKISRDDAEKFIMKSLNLGEPVFVGVNYADYKTKSGKDKRTGATIYNLNGTNHAVVIVQFKFDENGKPFFKFFDPGSKQHGRNGKFYILPDKITGKSIGLVSKDKDYEISEIRFSINFYKKIKDEDDK
jgi:hypothetical protein